MCRSNSTHPSVFFSPFLFEMNEGAALQLCYADDDQLDRHTPRGSQSRVFPSVSNLESIIDVGVALCLLVCLCCSIQNCCCGGDGGCCDWSEVYGVVVVVVVVVLVVVVENVVVVVVGGVVVVVVVGVVVVVMVVVVRMGMGKGQ
jgi:hypothetical protein